jgi:hypothetical protein
MNGSKKTTFPKNSHIWFGIFLYTVVTGLLIQLVLLPYVFTNWHSGNGLLIGLDTVDFNKSVLELISKISSNGWQEWNIKPQGQTVVGVAALFYIFINPHPWALLPLNGILNATGGLAIFQLLLIFIKDRKKALWATLPYLLFPTALSWTAQFHNDNYMIPGVALFLLGWVQLSSLEIWVKWRRIFTCLIYIVIGSFLIWFVRPYVLEVLGFLEIIVGALLIGNILISKDSKKIYLKQTILSLLMILVAVAVNFVFLNVNLISYKPWIIFGPVTKYAGELTDSTDNSNNSESRFRWTKTSWLPSQVDNSLKSLAKTRKSTFKTKAGSNIDADVNFTNSIDIVEYLPRAFEIGFLSPFPYQWFGQGTKAPNTMMRRVAGVEMILIYLSYAGLLFAIWRWRKMPQLWTFILFCSGMIVIYTLAVVNIGTLHRFRYGFLMPIVGLGITGWFEIFNTYVPFWKKIYRRR